MPAHRGGAGMFHPYLMGGALAGRGHNVTILTTGHPRGVQEERPSPGLRVLYLNGSPPDRYSDEFWRESAVAFESLHRESPFHAVVSDSAGAAAVAGRFATPVVTVCHAGLDMMAGEPQRRFFREVMHPLLETSRAVVCDAQAAADSVVRGSPSVGARVRVIRSFVDVA